MKISINNVGIVESAEVDLAKKLIVLCGPNNSGKTYTAYTVYGLLKMANGGAGAAGITPSRLSEELSKESWEFDLESLTSEEIRSILNNHLVYFKENLPNVFAVDPKLPTFKASALRLVDFDDSFLKKNMRRSNINFVQPLGPGKSLRMRKESGSSLMKYEINRDANVETLLTKEEDGRRRSLTPYLIGIILRSVFFPKSFILQTQRTAVNIFSRELSLKRFRMVDRMLKLQEQKESSEALAVLREARRYSMPIQDSLLIADDLKELEKTLSDFGGLASDLENSILKGKISTSKEGEYTFSPYDWGDLKITINLSGSMVNSLSGLVFYFRHLAKSGDFIVFDEPELNLHPDNQIKIARFIAKVVNSGFSVLLSTHSDYILHELNNLILLNGVTNGNFEKLEAKYGYTKLNKLESTSVQVLLFDNEDRRRRMITAQNVPVTEDGFSVRTIDESIHLLNATSTDIMFSKEEELV